MNRIALSSLALTAAAVGVTFGLGAFRGGDDGNAATTAAPQATGQQTRIANAESAAPASISRQAAVLDYPAEGTEFVVLRKGVNEWTCFPDYEPSPGNDPYCFDKYGMQWLDAYYAGKAPKLEKAGLAYRLQGGSDPSLTDPLATVPAKGEQWVAHGPHLVIFPAGGLDASDYSGDHHGGGVWVMNPGTAYEHLHVPVK